MSSCLLHTDKALQNRNSCLSKCYGLSQLQPQEQKTGAPPETLNIYLVRFLTGWDIKRTFMGQ